MKSFNLLRVGFFLVCFVLGRGHDAFSQVIPSTKGDLSHRLDYVVLTGEKIPELLGSDIDSVQVFAVNLKGEFHPISFQIDERFPGGDYIFVENRLPDTRRLSKKDEIVFMARDAGSRLNSSPDLGLEEIVKEVELTDHESGKRAWVYLVSTPIPPLFEPFSHLEFNPVEKSILGTTYFMSYEGGEPASQNFFWQASHLALSWSEPASAAGFRRSLTPDVLDSHLLEVRLSAFGDLYQKILSPKKLNASEAGEREGPVRVLRKIRMHPKFGFGLSAKPVTLLQVFYDEYMDLRIEGDLGGFPVGLLSSAQVTFGEVLVDDPQWDVALSQEEGTGWKRLEIRQANAGMRKAVTYWDVEANEEILKAFVLPAPDSEGAAPCERCIFYQLDLKKFPREPFAITLHRYFPKDASESAVQGFRAMRQNPLTVQIRSYDPRLVLRPLR